MKCNFCGSKSLNRQNKNVQENCCFFGATTKQKSSLFPLKLD